MGFNIYIFIIAVIIVGLYFYMNKNKEKKKTIRQVICGSSFCVTGVLGEFP